MAKFLRKFDLTSKRTWKQILSIALAVMAIAGSIFGVVKLTQFVREEKKVIHPTYTVGSLDSAGKPDKKSTSSIYTEDAFDAKGLELEPNFDGSISYQVFWYDATNNFVGSTTELTQGGEIKIPFGCKARVEITPTADEDGKISFFEKMEYARKLKIKVYKDSTYDASDFEEHNLTETKYFSSEAGSVTFNGDEVTFTENANTTYIYENTNGQFSAFYLKKFSVATDADAVLIRLKDGRTVSYYGELYPSGQLFNNEQSLPMSVNDAVALPEGATLYIVSKFDNDGNVNNAAETIVAFY